MNQHIAGATRWGRLPKFSITNRQTYHIIVKIWLITILSQPRARKDNRTEELKKTFK